jgi:hypothetical protein
MLFGYDKDKDTKKQIALVYVYPPFSDGKSQVKRPFINVA